MAASVDNLAKKTKEAEEKVIKLAKTPADLQRIRLEKLMKKPDKPAFIPAKSEEKTPRVFNPPEFIRNIWGSSAGAGSGDFHVYRGVRRREYARQKFSKEKSEKDKLDDEYQQKLIENAKAAELNTSKKRAKRMKKKMKQKAKKPKQENETEEPSESDSDN